ncbi:rod shape-determining protein MreC [Candidatus Pelagibacter sp.]|jgi:rod shape-determining protein MreC|nr:rod shape-determining protein MreC [Candidatus Pelagibacter sp.]
MASGRDDFVIAFRSAFLKKKDKQKFSLLSLILLSIVVIILSNINFKPIQFLKIGINEIIYRSSYVISKPENYLKKLIFKFDEHMNLFENYKNIKSELKNLKEEKVTNKFLKLENEKLRNLINENINSNEILAKVLIDRESPFLKSIILNKGTKDNVKIGMSIMDGVYLVGQIIEVNYTNSRALLLSDLNSKIPSVLAPQNIQAVISGTGKDYGIIEHTKDDIEEDLNVTDTIIYTSGLGGLFKPGIPIGKIFKDSKNKVDFFSDFTQLNYIKIISFSIGDKN